MTTHSRLPFGRCCALAAALGLFCTLAVSGQTKSPRPTPVSTQTLYAQVLPPVDMPEYPAAAAAAGIKGVVRVRVVVSPIGETESVLAISGPAALRDAAVDAVKSWTFVAVEISGVPRAVTGVVLLRFGDGTAGPSAWIVDAKGMRVRDDAFGLVKGGVPGGEPGGVPGGVPGGIPGGEASDVPEPPAPWEPPADARPVSGGVLAGRAKEKPQAAYPAMARAAKIEGAVVVEVVVGESGRVIMARAVAGHPLLRDAAVRAARGWIFEPTVLDGAPVKVIGTITFNFRRG